MGDWSCREETHDVRLRRDKDVVDGLQGVENLPSHSCTSATGTEVPTQEPGSGLGAYVDVDDRREPWTARRGRG